MEFRMLLKETNLGVPVETAFNNMLLRVPSEDLKIVMSAFSIQRNVGGNLADIMDQVAAMIRQRITIQGQIKVLTTQGKLSGAIVGLLPFGLGTVISFINYDYMSKLWTPAHRRWLSHLWSGTSARSCWASASSWNFSAVSSSTKSATSRSNVWIPSFSSSASASLGSSF